MFNPQNNNNNNNNNNSQNKFKDLSNHEISDLVYNTRDVKVKKYQPISTSFEKNTYYPKDFEDQKQLEESNKIEKSIKYYEQTNSSKSPYYQHSNSEIPSNDNDNNNNSNNNEINNNQENSNSTHKKVRLFQFIRLHTKLNELLSVKLERQEQAQQITSILKKIRLNMSIDEIILQHFDKQLLIPIITSADSFIRFEFLVEEMLSFVVPLTRNEETKERIMDDILSCGSLIFCLTFLRVYMTNSNIRTLTIELLVRSIDFILDIIKDNESNLKNRKYCNLNFIVHEMILHGAVTFLPNVLSLVIESHSEIGIRRTLKCIKLLVSRGNLQVTQSLATSQHYSLIRSSIKILRNASIEPKIDVTFILIGLIASSLVIAEKLVELNGWNDLRTMLMNTSINLSEIPSSWIEEATKSMKVIQMKQNRFSKSSDMIIDLFDMKQVEPLESEFRNQSNIDEDNNIDNNNNENYEYHYNTQEKQQLSASSPAILQSPLQNIERVHSIPDIDTNIDTNTNNNNNNTNNTNSSSQLASLPQSYWLGKQNSKKKKISPFPTLPSCKERLLNSPFGDSKKLFQIQQKKAQQAKESQRKLRTSNGEKKNSPRSLNKSMNNELSNNPTQNQTTPIQTTTTTTTTIINDNNNNKLNLPIDIKKQVVIAEKLFGDLNITDDLTTINQLSYEEKIQVMMMQVKNSFSNNSNNNNHNNNSG